MSYGLVLLTESFMVGVVNIPKEVDPELKGEKKPKYTAKYYVKNRSRHTEKKKEILHVEKIQLVFLSGWWFSRRRTDASATAILRQSKLRTSCGGLKQQIANQDGNGCRLLEDFPIPQVCFLFPKGSAIYTFLRRTSHRPILSSVMLSALAMQVHAMFLHSPFWDKVPPTSHHPDQAHPRHACVQIAAWLSFQLRDAELDQPYIR